MTMRARACFGVLGAHWATWIVAATLAGCGGSVREVHLGDDGGTLVGLCGGGCATKVYAT